LRSDGWLYDSDIGTAIQRERLSRDWRNGLHCGNEQDYHFKVLFLILKKLGFDWSESLSHLSYGMVDYLPEKKSREGTVVDADDLMQEMTDTAQKMLKI
jgi:arginyl-tRNA synthetase